MPDFGWEGKLRRASLLCLFLVACSISPDLLRGEERCVACHPKEVAGYAKSAMARSLTAVGSPDNADNKLASRPIPAIPDAAFEHAFSKTKFFVRSNSSGLIQGYTRADESSQQKAAFVIGSGDHAFGYLIQIDDHIFQSPLSYYTSRHQWDVAPGYERDPHPDFTRPVTPECLFCHSGKPLPVSDSLNRYQAGIFVSEAISCDRCHGDADAHLKSPIRGSIVNPAKLQGAARASVCEQCHLAGETRIANPGKSILDFRAGQTLESSYTTYVGARASGETIKVVSHAEQLALSLCVRRSGDKLWCGTCHNPHDTPSQPVAYFRDRCLTCHAATLEKAHAAPGRDCVSCHMPKTPARDGGHTAFTDHRIARRPGTDLYTADPDTLRAWRNPEPSLQDRNLALALVATGLENRSSDEVIRGYRLLNRLEAQFQEDPALLTTLGTVLMKAKQPAEALKRFEKVVSLKPAYPPYRMNVATALLATHRDAEAMDQLKKALAMDPLFRPAVDLLARLYREQSQLEKAGQLITGYNRAMGLSAKQPQPPMN